VTALFDPGLQPERTALAWRRTALSTAAAAAVLARVAQVVGDLAALAVAVAAGLLAGWCWVAAGRRYARLTASLREHGDLRGAALGPAAALTCAASTLLSLGALHLVVVGTAAS
jgi:putative membrane protein